MLRYTLTTRMRQVTPQKISFHIGGTGENAKFEEKETGMWLVSLEGIGVLAMSEKPEFKPGDEINLVLEGPINAKSDKTSV